ncbi:uncharacterized protein LOC128952540 isoform X2 [Oppia nitens]|uniref:uncharacterized protein LOC128952540 isoform X2 n=1 Tax=Oppia nitens TaxID=1686743 RepID=UPI0023DB8B18|nr:uncharacterized protein LOC128952540 isoform X2 [Oppia nitens]
MYYKVTSTSTSTSTEYSSSSSECLPTFVISSNKKNSYEHNVRELRNRSESPEPTNRLKFSDNSSGYGSTTSFSSAVHSVNKTPSLQFVVTTGLSRQQQQQQPLSLSSSDKKIGKLMNGQTIKENIITVLDQIDKRVAFLRETAHELEVEKNKLHRVLNSIITSDQLDTVDEVDREEIKVTSHGLLYRLNSVDVILKTNRNKSQEKALETVNNAIEKLSDCAKYDKQSAKQLCQSYLSACSSDHSFKSQTFDEAFQKQIIECTIDDQKRIKKSLENIFHNIDIK